MAKDIVPKPVYLHYTSIKDKLDQLPGRISYADREKDFPCNIPTLKHGPGRASVTLPTF